MTPWRDARPAPKVSKNGKGHPLQKLSAFRPQRKNANLGRPHGLAALDSSMRRDGYSAPMVAAADGEIFAGSKRLERAADVFGADVDPIVIESDGTRPIIHVRKDIPNADDPRAKRLGVADNVIGVMDWNPDGALLAQLAAEDEAIAALVKQENESLKAMAAAGGGSDVDAEPQIDRAQELLEKWKVRPGDLWQLGEHRLLCGDSTKAEDVARVMEDERVDCTVTDPPYGVGVDYREFQDTPENVKALIQKVMPIILEHLPAALTPGVPAMWDYPRPDWVGAWIHPAPVGGCPWGFVGNNPILFYGADPYLKMGRGRRPDSIIMASDREGESGHPTPKPIRVWEWLIERLTPELGMKVFDPFCGSGTTLIVCERTGRRGRGIEINPAYCAVTLERYAQATGKQPRRIE